jgi:sulfofructose kinase
VSGTRIVGVGLCVVDHLYVVETLQFAGSTTRSSERLVSTGGMTGNALVQAARLGCEAHLLSALGQDPEGRFVRRELDDAGVETGRVVFSDALPTTVAVVLVHRQTGERHFIVPDRSGLESGAPDFDLTPIERDSVVLVDGHFSAQAMRAVQRARSVGATVVGDFSWPRPAYLELLPYVDYPIVPAPFADAYGDGDVERGAQRLSRRFGGCPVVTQGAEGGLFVRGGRLQRYPAEPTEVRDTTGAGDAFHGAFAAGLARGLGFEASIALAARAAAVCCSALGATQRLLGRDELATPRSRGPAAAP